MGATPKSRADTPKPGSLPLPDTSPDHAARLSSGTVQVRAALDQTHTALLAAGLPTGTCGTAQIILGEVLNNVVEHAYLFEEGRPIDLSIWVTGAGLYCRIQDEGAPMPNGVPPAGLPLEFDPTIRDDLPEGGFGWAMVRELTQDLQYFRTDTQNQLLFLIPNAQP